MSNLIRLKQIQGGIALRQDVDRLSGLVEHRVNGLVTVVGDLQSQINEVVKNKADKEHTHEANDIVESEEKQFVSKEKKDQYDENTVYTNDMPTVNPIGGIAAGTTFNEMPVNQVLTKLLYPYVKPEVSASTTPNGGVFEKGAEQNVTNIAVNVVKKSEKISKIECFDDQESLGVKQGKEVENGGKFDFTIDKTFNSEKKAFKVSVTDAEQKMYSVMTGEFRFVYPYYMGVMDAGQNTATEDIVKALTKKVEEKGNKQHSFTVNNQRMVFAYPKAYGALKSIIDPNGFDNFSSFGREEVQITGLDGTPQDYYVYVNSPSTNTNFVMKFNY